MEQTELKPCPFCGKRPYTNINGVQFDNLVHVTRHGETDWYYVCCPLCKVCCTDRPTREEAVELWNTRTQPPRPEPAPSAMKSAEEWIRSDQDGEAFDTFADFIRAVQQNAIAAERARAKPLVEALERCLEDGTFKHQMTRISAAQALQTYREGERNEH